MTVDRALRKDIRDLKRLMTALRSSYKTLLRVELIPLQKRLSKLEARLSRSRR